MADVFAKYKRLKSQYITEIDELGKELTDLSDAELKSRALALKQQVREQLAARYQQMKDPSADLLLESKDLLIKTLPRAFALAREATRRLTGMRHHEEQIIGGLAMHLGSIAEMKNGEGKTIVALLPAYLNALFTNAEYEVRRPSQPQFLKRNIHVVTTNDYLARRDYIWLRPVYEFLGLSVGYLQEIHAKKSSYAMSQFERKTMYSADIVYGATQEFIFDYLRDNNQLEKRLQVQSDKYFVIIDEVDHVLLDEARTPHILADIKPNITKQDLELVYLVNNLARRIFADQEVYILANMENLILTESGSEIIRILGANLIDGPTLHKSMDAYIPIEEIVGLVYELVYYSASKHQQQLAGPLLDEIGSIYRKSSRGMRFYRTDSTGSILGFSDVTRQKIITLLVESWKDDPSPFDLRSLMPLLKILLKNIGAFQEIVLASGLTPQEFSQVITRESTFNILQNLTLDPESSARQMASLAVDLLEYILVDLVEVSLADINRLRLFTREVTVFLYIFLNRWGKEPQHFEISSHLRKIMEIYLFELDKSESSLAAEAFLSIITSTVLPILSNLVAPRKPLRTHNKVFLVLAVCIKVVISITSVEQPSNHAEKEIFETLESLGRAFTNKLFILETERSNIIFTYWTKILVEDFARTLKELHLWEAPKTRLHADFQVNEIENRVTVLLEQALRAYSFHQRNNQYLVQPARMREYDAFTGRLIAQDVVIIGELSGRIMPGRRWQQWLHSFLEAKEGIPVRQEQRSVARVSAQGYFKMYPKLAGMTGTAHIGQKSQGFALLQKAGLFVRSMLGKSEKGEKLEITSTDVDPVVEEFKNTYHLEVVVVPEHREKKRDDLNDTVYLSKEAKNQGILEQILAVHETGRPILVETVSVAQSQEIAGLLREYAKNLNISLDFQVLNALNDEQEAEIITQAGSVGAITISTQLAGRGTDIVVSSDAIQRGGLYVLGVERRWSRRWDNQISGRAGRQGEPGTSQFFMSFDDEILLHVREMQINMLKKVGLFDDIKEAPIESGMITQMFYNQQIDYEGVSSRVREQTEEYDKVLSKYRLYLYVQREDSIAETHTCPICKNEARQLSVHSEAYACPTCQPSAGQPQAAGLWRPFFERVITSIIRWSSAQDSLEDALIEKYADDPDPMRWKIDLLAEELSKWVKTTVRKQQIAQGIDFDNTANPRKETNRLKLNIYGIIEENRRQELDAAAQKIIQKFEKEEHNPRMWEWDFQKLFKTINSELNLEIPYYVYTELNTIENRAEIQEKLKDILGDAIKYSFSQGTSNIYKEKTLVQLVEAFNPALKEPISNVVLHKTLETGTLQEELIHRMAKTYNELVHKFGKPAIYQHENALYNEIMGDMWSQLLTESDLILEEVRGANLKDRLLDYKYRIGRLFNQHYSEAGISFMTRVLTAEKELASRKERASQEHRYLSARDLCPCGSGKDVQGCCGKELYSYLKMSEG